MMLRNIMDGKYEFVSPEWDIISDSAKDLVSLPPSLPLSLITGYTINTSSFASA